MNHETVEKNVGLMGVLIAVAISFVLYICSRPNSFGISAYIVPIEIIATQPSAPECTWPIVQSV